MRTPNEMIELILNVAKGIARDELSYAMEQLNHYVRDMLMLMLDWYIGVHYDFNISSGKNGKYFKKYLSKDVYERFKATYTDADYEHMWEAVFEAFYLFGEIARVVAARLGYSYDEGQESGIENYMNQVRGRVLKY